MQPTQSYAIKRHTGRTKQRKNRRSSISAASRFLLLKNLFFPWCYFWVWVQEYYNCESRTFWTSTQKGSFKIQWLLYTQKTSSLTVWDMWMHMRLPGFFGGLIFHEFIIIIRTSSLLCALNRRIIDLLQNSSCFENSSPKNENVLNWLILRPSKM